MILAVTTKSDFAGEHLCLLLEKMIYGGGYRQIGRENVNFVYSVFKEDNFLKFVSKRNFKH